MPKVHVKFFAIFREFTGIKTEWKEIADGTPVEKLWDDYRAAHARLGNIRAAYAVNQKLVKPDHVLRDGDEVGFLPPVSGGAEKGRRQKAKGKRQKPESNRKDAKSAKKKKQKTWRSSRPFGFAQGKLRGDSFVTRQRLNLAALVKQVEFPGAGAIVTFSGVVRDHARGQRVDHLEYEAYPEMAEAALREIIAEIKARWSDARVAMAHRIGRLEVGEASLLIAVAAPHRPEAYAASRYALERVKAILPVWKKEFASDTDYWVEGPIAGEMPPEKAEEIAREER